MAFGLRRSHTRLKIYTPTLFLWLYYVFLNKGPRAQRAENCRLENFALKEKNSLLSFELERLSYTLKTTSGNYGVGSIVEIMNTLYHFLKEVLLILLFQSPADLLLRVSNLREARVHLRIRIRVIL